MATHSSYSCLENPWVEEPGGLHSIGSRRVGRDWNDLVCLGILLRLPPARLPRALAVFLSLWFPVRDSDRKLLPSLCDNFSLLWCPQSFLPASPVLWVPINVLSSKASLCFQDPLPGNWMGCALICPPSHGAGLSPTLNPGWFPRQLELAPPLPQDAYLHLGPEAASEKGRGNTASCFYLHQVVLVVKNPPVNAGDIRLGFVPWVGMIHC